MDDRVRRQGSVSAGRLRTDLHARQLVNYRQVGDCEAPALATGLIRDLLTLSNLIKSLYAMSSAGRIALTVVDELQFA